MSTLEQALAALEEADPEQRLQALNDLADLADSSILPTLVSCMQRDPDPVVQARAADLARFLSAQVTNNPRDPYGQFRIS